MAQSLTTLQSTALGPVLTVSGVSPTVAVTTTDYPGSATAANPAGGETLTITGTGFNAGVIVYVGSTICTTTYVSATSLTFLSPANSVGSYVLYVFNTDGTTGVNPAGITYSAIPVWVTAAGALTGAALNAPYSTSVSATGDGITYSVTTGSLPTGLSLNASTGAITGTPTVEATSNFAITATDAQNQAVARSFSIAVVGAVSTVEYLVVAGGGGGGRYGGGGGAGSLTTGNLLVTTATSYTVTIGAGGAASTDQNAGGVQATQVGEASVFASVTAAGGGGGGNFNTAGGNGGSGGGAGRSTGAARSGGTASAGFPGGNITGAIDASGGGGGAGAAGSNAVNASPGAPGGIGVVNPITGSTAGAYDSATSSYYLAGGGAGENNNGVVVARSKGGGGSNTPAAGTEGIVNTGGGGGGGGTGGNPQYAGAGGSGVVVIRYADTYPAAASTTGSPTITVAGGYRFYTFTGSGSITF